MPSFPLRRQSDSRIKWYERESYRILSTPETQGSCDETDEILPSFEIQTSFGASSNDVLIKDKTGSSQETVVVISEGAESHDSKPESHQSKPESRQAPPALADSVADAWLHMGEDRFDALESSPESSSSSHRQKQTQNIFRRTPQWWKAPCVNATTTKEEGHQSGQDRNVTKKGRRATDQSRNSRSRNKKHPDVLARTKHHVVKSLLQSPPTIYHHYSAHSGASSKLKQAVQPLRNCCRIKPANQVSASLFNSLQEEEPRSLSPASLEKTRNQELNEAVARRSHRKSDNIRNMTGTCNWKTAVDPKSGKTYYYHIETRETQWRKPLDLASETEKEAMQEKERKQRDFFSVMEANILRNLHTGTFASPPQKATMLKDESNLAEQGTNFDSSDDEDETKTSRENSNKPEVPIPRPDLVRTISSMDERILKDLVLRVPSHRNLSLGEATDSPIEVTSRGIPINTRAFSEGNLEDTELLSFVENTKPLSRPNALRNSTRQLSLGTVLSSLPEEHEPSMESFGDLSMHDMGLSEQESEALLHFAQASTEMAMLGEESFVGDFDGLTLEEGDEDATESSEKEVTDGSQKDEEDEEEDPLKNMDNGPFQRTMQRSGASHRVLPGGTGATARPRKMSRRNTCGTLYVGSTLSQPDIDATIKCVCGVIRAHILQSEMDAYLCSEFEVFNDQESQQRRGSKVELLHERPTLDEVSAFYRYVFQRAQMESDCIIMSLIYVERLIKSTEGKLRPNGNNWRSVVFSSMVLASKVWDDLSMWNGDFSQTCPAGVQFSVKRINELELAVLDALGYKVKVPASEYAKYYFLLRAMLIKSGLGGDAMKEMNPLDVEGAKRLQIVSSKYQRTASLRQLGPINNAVPRSKSLTVDAAVNNRPRSEGSASERKGKVSLEHMVPM